MSIPQNEDTVRMDFLSQFESVKINDGVILAWEKNSDEPIVSYSLEKSLRDRIDMFMAHYKINREMMLKPCVIFPKGL